MHKISCIAVNVQVEIGKVGLNWRNQRKIFVKKWQNFGPILTQISKYSLVLVDGVWCNISMFRFINLQQMVRNWLCPERSKIIFSFITSSTWENKILAQKVKFCARYVWFNKGESYFPEEKLLYCHIKWFRWVHQR